MVSIKLRPVGKAKQISYRVAVMPKHTKLKGRFIEDLGFYNPHTKAFSANKERVAHWIGVGAQASATVHNLFVKHKIVEGDKIAVHNYKKPEAAPVEVKAPEKASVAESKAEAVPEEKAEVAPEAAPEA
jgi:small subunit ribosomal protein S16